MLKLMLRQFRCWEDLELKIPLGSIVLIKGKNGAGKTTLFSAIIWCLYGRVIRKVFPKNNPNAKTKVTLQIPHKSGFLCIERNKNPSRLILTLGDDTYEDTVAQSFINDLFGTYDIWSASCYIPERSQNSFLTSPNDGKMELLNKIAFHEEDPSLFIDRIDKNITFDESTYRVNLEIFNKNLLDLQSQLTLVDTSKALSPFDTSRITSLLSSNQEKYHNLLKVKSDRDINIAIYNNLQNQLNQALSKYDNIPKVTTDPFLESIFNKFKDIPTNDIIPKLNNLITLFNSRAKFSYELSSLKSKLNLPDFMNYSHSDYESAVSSETLYNQSKNIVSGFGLPFHKSAIDNFISNYNSILLSQDSLKIQSQLSILENKLNNLSIPTVYPEIIPKIISAPDYSRYDTSELLSQVNDLLQKQGSLQSHIEHLQKGFNVVKCPKCTVSLVYQTGKLFEADADPIDNNDLANSTQELNSVKSKVSDLNLKIKQLNLEKDSLKSRYEKSTKDEELRLNSLREKTKYLQHEDQRKSSELEQIKKSIADILIQKNLLTSNNPPDPKATILTAIEIDRIKKAIGVLSTVKILDPPIKSSQYIFQCLNQQTINNQCILMQKNLDEISQQIPEEFRNEKVNDLSLYLDKIRSHLTLINNVANQKSQLDNQIMSIEQEIIKIKDKIIPDPSHEISSLSVEISNLQNSLESSEKAHKVLKFHEFITRQREDLVSMTDNLSNLRTFKQIALETECKILQDIVNSINSSIQTVCNSIFDNHITIALNLFKTFKSTKTTKPKVNFTISYKGCVYEDISEISGGEVARASLALTLALKRLSSCPFLLLDESMASLHVDIKDSVLKSLRENTNDTVLVIMHEGVEGVFDHIIDIDSFVS